MCSNVYPRRRRGLTDEYQRWLYSINWAAILDVVRSNPGLNIRQIAERLVETRERIFAEEKEQQAKLPQALEKFKIDLSKRKLPKSRDSRKTVRKHLHKMLSMGLVTRIGLRHYTQEKRQSTELTQSVDDLLKTGTAFNWSYPLAHNVAIYRIAIDPEKNRHRFDDFTNSLAPMFTETLFFLNYIVQDAIGSGYVSERGYNERTGSISFNILTDGLNKYFADTELCAITFAFSPPKLVEFLRTPIGQDLAKKLLASTWTEIMFEAKKKQAILQRSSRR
jgi:hypothetical protein